MSYHENIRAACKAAQQAINGAADTGSEASIYHLPIVLSDLVDVLVRDDRFIDALKAKRITISKAPIRPRKFS